ncbi:unnamed protein product, partial [Laminaria digitata]
AEELAAVEGAAAVRLREELDANVAKLSGTVEELQESRKAFVEAGRAKACLKEEVERLRPLLAALEGTLEERSAFVESLEGVRSTQERLLQEKGDALEERRKEAESLRLQIDADSGRFAEEKDAFLAEAVEAEGRLEHAKDEIETLKELLEEAQAVSSKGQDDQEALSAQINVLESELESKTREAGVVELALVASKVDAEELTRERTRLLERTEELEGERSARLTQISAQEARAEEERARSLALQVSLDTVTKEACAARESQAEARAGLSMTREALTQAQAALEVERGCVGASRADLATTQERLRRLRDEDLATALERLRLTASDLDTAHVELEGVRDELEAERSELEGMREELESTRDELEGMREELEAERGNTETARGEVAALEAARDAARVAFELRLTEEVERRREGE